jgi:hypothetical protein
LTQNQEEKEDIIGHLTHNGEDKINLQELSMDSSHSSSSNTSSVSSCES